MNPGFWALAIFVAGVTLGALFCVIVWLSRSRLLQRILALADLADVMAEVQQPQEGGDEDEEVVS